MTRTFLIMALVALAMAGDVLPRKDLPPYKPPPFPSFDKYSPTYPKLGFPDYSTGQNPFRSYDYAPKKAVVPVKKAYDYDYAPAGYGKAYADPYNYKQVVPAAVPVKKVYAPDYDYRPAYPAVGDYYGPGYGKELGYKAAVVPVKKAYDYDYKPVYPVKKPVYDDKFGPGFAPVSGLGAFGAKGVFAGKGLGPAVKKPFDYAPVSGLGAFGTKGVFGGKGLVPVKKAFDYAPDYVKPIAPVQKGFGFAPNYVKPVVPVKKGFGFAPDYVKPVVPVKKGFGFAPDYVKPVVPVRKGFDYAPDYVRPAAYPVKKVVPAYSDYDYRPSYYDSYRGDDYKPALLAKDVYPGKKALVPVRAVYRDPYPVQKVGAYPDYVPAKRVGAYPDYVPAKRVGAYPGYVPAAKVTVVKPAVVKTPARVFPTYEDFGKDFGKGLNKDGAFGTAFSKDFLPKFKF
ncbi:adhesive plaque matrix protein-like [Aplysia californica]|uniref:Adhesive plaque matrix protein-like n=1 Tax=Aplysia californica TaxID=6500 RepID=A0ABM0JXG5_APLCA|nr:adhesive plaque matrix protein-like [Aplysia californica]